MPPRGIPEAVFVRSITPVSRAFHAIFTPNARNVCYSAIGSIMDNPANVGNGNWIWRQRTWIARRISDVLSPPVLSGSLAILLTRLATPTWASALGWSALYVVIADLLPLAYLLRLLRRGIVSDLHIGIRAERLRPLIAMLICTTLAFVAAVVISAPHALRVFLGLTLIQGVVLTLVTIFWQISFHAAAASALISAACVIYGLAVGAMLAPVLIAVAWSRIHLRRHTFRQIAAGALVSIPLFGPILAYALL